MNAIISKLLTRANDLANLEPAIALFLAAALIAITLTALFQNKSAAGLDEKNPSLIWTLYRNLRRLLWTGLLIWLFTSAISILLSYLRQTESNFERTHGRITEANYNAVQTIWGSEQVQSELNVDVYHEEEVTERIESEDPTKPAVIHKKTVHVSATGNPFVTTRHDITLRQNPRKKGSAFYGGYETDCSFNWRLRNPSDVTQKCLLTFPLPASGAMYDGMVAMLDGKDVLPEMQIKDASLVLERSVQPNEEMDFRIAFKSRGLSYWYFQVREPREIRDFTLTMNLPDMPKAKLNYPDGCMTPTSIASTNNAQGTVLTYRLDHALTDKGMGIALPQLPQPGATTRAVLDQTADAWLLVFAVLSLSFTLAGARLALLLAILFSTATAFGYGLLADFSDLLFGFWGTAVLILLPLFGLLALLLTRAAPKAGKWIAAQFVLFSIIYPCLAGLDDTRQSLYLNLFALEFLAFIAWLLLQYLSATKPAEAHAAVTAPVAAI